LKKVIVFVVSITIIVAIFYFFFTRNLWISMSELEPRESTGGVGILFLLLCGASCMFGTPVGYVFAQLIWHDVLKRN